MLRALMIRKKLDTKKAELEQLRATNDFEKREAELEQAIAEAETDEEKAAVEEEVTKFETEKADFEAKEKSLDEEVRALESELESVEKETEPAPAEPQPVPAEPEQRDRKEISNMETRKFFGMNHQERDAFFANENVKKFLSELRSLKGGQQRAVTGGNVTIPTEILELIRQNIMNYSKLIRRVRLVPVAGKARQVVAGAIPEAVWTEMCANLNELNIGFMNVEVDGYKVGGYIPVCNALLEDSDISLATEVITMLGQAIGYALDKAILYGTGTKMPKGIVPRLLQTSDPSDPTTTIPWVDLHVTNVKSISGQTGVNLFKAIVTNAGAANGKYSRGAKVWVMNDATYTKLLAESLSVNAAGAVVAGVNGTMPVVGGDIEVLDFIPNNVIIGGYFDLYLLAEREGSTFERSEHAQFIQDNTVFKGTARYDGRPVIAEAFVAMDIAGGTVSTSGITFAEDSANP